MAKDGKSLEEFVTFVERTLSKSFMVETNVRKYFDDGTLVAEFDIVVTGVSGGIPVSGTIECRDRPNSRTPDAAWIQQLAGRRLQFEHDWVIAVSTTGFSRPARIAAKTLNIELRIVESLSAEQFRGWCPGFETLGNLVRTFDTKTCYLKPPGGTDPVIDAEADAYIKAGGLGGKILKTSNRDEHHSITQAIRGFLTASGIWERVPATGEPYPFAFKVSYPDEDHYVLNLPSGATVRVQQFMWSGVLRATQTEAPVVDRREYRQDESTDIISQVVAFEPVQIGGPEPVRLEIHRIGDHSQPNLVQVAIKPLSKGKN